MHNFAELMAAVNRTATEINSQHHRFTYCVMFVGVWNAHLFRQMIMIPDMHVGAKPVRLGGLDVSSRGTEVDGRAGG